ncbi:hypothetical protein [Streptomyces sp. NPDC085466]|uniref:hypothetical protein n=1 Tax=Streptomyces sp. NPDC085466 TaxID=3365725 RepID=UPI0037D31128
MGIESDRMVFDYLSEVGDLAQQRHLPPGERSALVAGLRDEIDRRRAGDGEESPGAVRGILGDLGTPDEVVRRAAPWWSARATSPENAPSSGEQQSAKPRSGKRSSGKPSSENPGSGKQPSAATAAVPAPRGWWQGGPDGGDATAPGLAGGTDGEDALAPGFAGGTDDGDTIAPGFVGGIEAPELFRPPDPEAPDPEAPEPDAPDSAPPPPPGRLALLARLLRRRRPQEPEPSAEPALEPDDRRRLAHPFLLLAALLLIAGAAFGWLLALAVGWLIAYGSRRLTPGQTKTAVFVLPGLAAAGGIAWLWGRVEGRWGAPVAQDAMGAAVAETWPWTLRAAALLSALYLTLRARRP